MRSAEPEILNQQLAGNADAFYSEPVELSTTSCCFLSAIKTEKGFFCKGCGKEVIRLTDTPAEPMKPPQEVIADILARYSVADLREMSGDDLARGERMLDKHSDRPEVITSGETNLIKWWKIRSQSGNKYEVRRFENFVFCSCLDFFFSKSCCRHVLITTKHFRRREHREVDAAPYLKPTTEHRTEKIGNIRI